MTLTDIGTIKAVLTKYGFSFKKSLGQNFLVNPTVCPRMAESATANGETAVIEIGPGIGVLTAELAKRAEKVISIELDERLRPVLLETLGDYSNVEVIFADALKLDIKALIEEKLAGQKVSVCANLPYYITSPIIMRLLESRLPVTSITVMVQKEAADRMCAEVGSRDAGAVTVAVDYYSKAETLFNVSRGSFMPAPNVDSTVMRLNIRTAPLVQLKDEKRFFKLVRSAFAQRRKTLVNSVSSGMGIPKEQVKSVLVALGLDENVRAEKLTVPELAAISERL